MREQILTNQDFIRDLVISRLSNLKLSSRKVARDIRISESSFSRFLNGKNLGVGLLKPVATWCNLTLSQALGIEKVVKSNQPTIHSIIELIQNDKFLSAEKKIELATWFGNTYTMFRRIQ